MDLDYQLIFENVDSLCLILSPALAIVAVSEAYLAATMTRREEIIGRNLFEVFPDNPDDPTATGARNLKASLLRVVATSRPDAMAVQKYDVRGPSGAYEERFWSPRNSPICGADGQLRYVLHRVEDVTELMRLRTMGQERADELTAQVIGRARDLQDSNRELRESNDRTRRVNNFLDSVIENLPNMIFVKEAGQLRFERINRFGEELLGVKRDKLLGKNDYDFFPTDEADFFTAKDRETLSQNRVVDIPEEPIQTSNGLRWLHTRKVPIFDAAGDPAYLLGISEDITDSKAQAQALREAKDQAEALNRELESFSYSVAHDLRAPLRSIDGFSQAIIEDQGDKLDATGQDYLRRVRSAAQRMALLIDDLLDLARVARTELQRQTVDVTNLARATVARLQEAAPARQLDLALADGLTAEADPRLLGIVFENLLGNAWKFTAKKERARIEVGCTDGTFFVRDDGAGFDMTYAAKLFSAFQRLHSTAEFQGTGIGLALVQRIVRRHGGRVWAEGAVGKGACFYFTL